MTTAPLLSTAAAPVSLVDLYRDPPGGVRVDMILSLDGAAAVDGAGRAGLSQHPPRTTLGHAVCLDDYVHLRYVRPPAGGNELRSGTR